MRWKLHFAPHPLLGFQIRYSQGFLKFYKFLRIDLGDHGIQFVEPVVLALLRRQGSTG